MKLGLFSIGDVYTEHRPVRYEQVLRSLWALAGESERAGFSDLWIAEHHFQSSGVYPSPSVLLAALGQFVHRLRLGAMVNVLSIRSPLLLAEDLCLLDQVLGGRLNIGVGSGYVPLELLAFGVGASQRRSLFQEHLDRLLLALRGERVPTPGGLVRLNVLPVQRPHPPVTWAIQGRESLTQAARRGFGVAVLPYAMTTDVTGLSDLVRDYHREQGPGASGAFRAVCHIYVGPHPDRAREALQRHLDSRMFSQDTFYQGDRRRPPTRIRVPELEDRGFALLGSERDVTEGLEAWRRSGVDELLVSLDFGDLSLSEALETIQTLGRAFPGELTQAPDPEESPRLAALPAGFLTDERSVDSEWSSPPGTGPLPPTKMIRSH